MSELVTDFDVFWAAYPRKTAKGAARKAWAKLAPDAATVQKMLDALNWQRNQPQWMKDGGQYIPMPATYLNQERWEDEPVNLPQFSDRTVRSLRAIYGTGDVH
ncbi:MAG: hypothetical protein ACKVQA_06960 [Burkholderiales bacterium]